jgi:hypothetical protein
MKANHLLNFLLKLEATGTDMSKVDVLYRYDSDSDEVNVMHVEEDLYDPSDNTTPISIMLKTSDREV